MAHSCRSVCSSSSGMRVLGLSRTGHPRTPQRCSSVSGMRVLGLSRTGHPHLPQDPYYQGVSRTFLKLGLRWASHLCYPAEFPDMHVTPRGVAPVLSGGISGHAREPIPPSAEGLSHTGRWPHESTSAPGPAAAILLTADNLCKQGLSVLFEYVRWY
jgi:hypothetical protein